MEFVKFTPGEYLDFEKEAVQLRLDIAAGKAKMPPMGGPFGKMEPKPYSEEEIVAYNKKWDPYNPLFNDPEYAKKAGYAGIPAYPGFCMAMAMGAPGFDKTMPSGGFYYTNDGTDIYLSRPVVAGDFLKNGEKAPTIWLSGATTSRRLTTHPMRTGIISGRCGAKKKSAALSPDTGRMWRSAPS